MTPRAGVPPAGPTVTQVRLPSPKLKAQGGEEHVASALPPVVPPAVAVVASEGDLRKRRLSAMELTIMEHAREVDRQREIRRYQEFQAREDERHQMMTPNLKPHLIN